ncbi:hypothetical protein SAMN05444365_104273 [Micromonospora pattaloongensis]|uniref:Uncharacterized protein n=1 Tax=Micromonospora pattaloongensis TaxID=405436 RepID=A0A1H3P162_9ACTN|nr:hypothetical protein [Micromonospora pattaloongensis]SDY94884.1 hypothetical protein SAMN05444365_104273 [Micromonospora pattaloongensis]
MTWPQLAALAALGAFHGINPAMGWLFAVARGMQEGGRAALLRSLPPIAAGHAASVALVASLVTATRSAGAGTAVAVGGGVLLVGFGLWRLLSERHFRWVGMRLTLPQLAGWSFLMSSAHGAGLMLLPLLAAAPPPGHHAGHAGHLAAAPAGAWEGLGAAGVHTAAMFGTAALLALVVYEVVGLGVLRTAWFNLDRLWAGVLVAAGAITLLSTV